MIKRIYLLLFICTFCLIRQASSQMRLFEPDIRNTITSSTYIAGLPAPSYNDYLDTVVGVLYDSFALNPSRTDLVSKSTQDFVILGVKDTSLVVGAYHYAVTLQILKFYPNGTVDGTTTIVLDLSYDPDSLAPYKDMSVFKFSGFHKFSVVVKDIKDLNASPSPTTVPRVQLAKNFYIELGVSSQQYDKVNINVYPNSSVVGSNLRVSWGTATGSVIGGTCPVVTTNNLQPVEYDLEWTYVDDYYDFDLSDGSVDNRFSTPGSISYDFGKNASRVRLYKPTFDIPLIYNRGAIVFRVRAVRPNNETLNYKDIYYGNWNLPESGTVSSSESCKAYVISTAHRDQFNWQYSINFAEDGKYKHVINYFDGSLRNRQTQTKINSDPDYIIAVDKLYDFEGNKVVETLPVPVIQSNLNYLSDLTLKNVTNQQYTAIDFDSKSCSEPAAFTILSTTSKARSYYSTANPDKALYQQFVPDAKGYPLMQSIYSPDKKLLWQGGAGEDHQLWNRHGTRYEYTRANQEELNILFGSEAGPYQFYPKTVMTDPNGQTSFTISNLAGQTVATGLIGLPDTSNTPLFGIPTSDTGSNYCFNILTGGAQDRLSDGWGLNTNFYVEKSANHSLQYRVKVPGFNAGCGDYLWAKAYYEYSATNECGQTVIPTTSGVLGEDTFNATPENYLYAPIRDTFIHKGKYYVNKSLTFRKYEMNNLVSEYVKLNEPICYHNEKWYVKNAVESASFPCENSIVPGPCDLKKKQMMSELWPGAKYGGFEKDINGKYKYDTTTCLGVTYIYVPVTRQIIVNNVWVGDDTVNPNSIFTPIADSGWRCQGDLEYITEWVTLRYQSECIDLPDSVIKNGVTYKNLATLPYDTFIYIFNDEIAEALLPLHPEYCKLSLCDDGVYVTELESFQSFKQAEIGNRFSLDSMIKYDPLCGKVEPGDLANLKTALSHLKNMPDKRMDQLAIEQAYCAAGNVQEVAHCLKYLYEDSIQNFGFINDAVKQKYYEKLQQLYLINRAYVLQQMTDTVGATCNPCPEHRMTLVEPGAFFSVFAPNGGFDTSLGIPGWIDTLFININDPGFDMSTLTLPTQLLDSMNIVQTTLDSARVNTILASLMSCSSDPSKIESIKTKLYLAISGGASLEDPNVIATAIVDAGVALTDLCNGFLPNLKSFNTTNDIEYSYDCERPAFYLDLKEFFNRSKILDAIKGAILSGTTEYGFYLNPANSFENRVADALGCGTSDSIIIQGFLDTIQTSVSTHVDYVKIKMKKYSLSGSVPEAFLYLYNKVPTEPALHGDPTLTLEAEEAYCINDDLGKSLSEGKLGENTAMLNYSHNDGVNPIMTYSYYVWSKEFPFMGTSQSKLPIRCITCIDIKEALKTFSAILDTGNINHFNHPNTEKHLTNYLNHKLNERYTYSDYLELMKACAVTDSIVIPRYFATVKVNCNTKALADGFMDDLNNFSQLDLFDFRYQYASNRNVIGLDFNQVAPDSLQYYKHSILNIATNAGCTATWLPEENLQVFVLSGCSPSPAITSYGSFSDSIVNYYVTSGKYVSGHLYTFTGTYTDALQRAQLLSSMYNSVAQCHTSFVLPDAMLLRNDQYGTSISNDYLTYIYGLDGYSRHEIRDSINTTNLENQVDSYSGMGLMYEDPYCSKSIRDLYIFDNLQGSHPGSVRLDNIIDEVTSILTGDRLFLADGVTSAGSGNTFIFRKASGVHWYRHFDSDTTLWNVHLQPPAYPPFDLSTLRLDSLRIGPGTDSIFRFTAYMHYDGIAGEVVECKGYTDFTVGYGKQLSNIVLFDKPGYDFCLDTIDCEYNLLQDAIMAGKVRYRQAFNDTVGNITERMFTHYMNTVKDSLFLCAANQKNMVTLYYYDLNGNLTKTIPPAGVGQSTEAAQKVSKYKYDSRNLVIEQSTPDQGTTTFYHDVSGRMVFSQNAKQKPDGKFSYTLYDKLSRPVETGEVILTVPNDPPPAFVANVMHNAVFPMDSIIKYIRTRNRLDVVVTTYDTARVNLGSIAGQHLSAQENLINRVSSISYYPSKAADYTGTSNATPEFSTHYSYDIVGNVNTVTYDCLAMLASNQRYKRVDYDYDQLSGKVNMISYNRGRGDQFYQQYKYDADNRIITAMTSNDGIIWNRDAAYIYYKHGPLANARIGSKQVQSIDYAYTIQGWLKAINGDVLRPDKTMNGDASILPVYARDVIAHTLNYFNGDYQPIGSVTVTNFAAPDRDLYNGNITRTNTAILGLGNQRGTYTYDQAHRLLGATYETVNESNLTVNTPSAIYQNRYQYDYDGNLQRLDRYDGNGTLIDSLAYNYYGNTNKLERVNDRVATTGGEDVQPNQTWQNYVYDGIGNLIKDSQAHLKMNWNLYGKLKSVEYTTTSPLEKANYYYDGLGNRVRKVKSKSVVGQGDLFEGEYYVRDASGNILATYRLKNKYAKIKLIEAANTDIRTAPAYPTYVNVKVGSIGGYISALVGKSILDMPTWVDAQTDKPVSFYLNNGGGLYSEILMGASAPDYLNDLQDYSIMNPGAELYGTAFVTATGPMHPLMDQVLTFETEGKRMIRHFDELMAEADVDNMWEMLSVGTPRTPGAYVANANTLYNWMVMNGKQPELGAAMVDVINNNINNEDGMKAKEFFTATMHDDVIYESLNLRSDDPVMSTQFEQQLKEVLYSGANMGDVTAFFDDWGTPATDWLTGYTSLEYRMETVYTADADNVLADWLSNVSSGSVLDSILADVDEVSGFEYFSAREEASWVDVFGPPNYTELYQYGVIVDTTDLSEHHIYGNSRLGVQWYPTGTMRQTYDVNPATPRLTKLTDSTVWFSYPYYDLIKKGQKEPYGQGHTDTMYVSRTLGYRQYEMTDHLGNVLATILDRKTGIDTASADTIAFYNPDIASSQDYYPFGMRMGERHSEINDTIYRYGFNGMEKDNERYGAFKHYDFGSRIYDPRVGRWASIDPLAKKYSSMSPYSFSGNSPILIKDPDGKDLKIGGDMDLSLADIKSLVPEKYRSQIETVNDEIVFNNFDQLPADVQQYEGVALLNKLIISDKTYKYSVANEATAKRRSDGKSFSIQLGKKDANGNLNNKYAAQYSVLNLSTTPRTDVTDPNDPAGFVPEDGVDGSVTIQPGNFSRKHAIMVDGEYEYERSNIVFHELDENLLRTEGTKGKGMDYKDAHEAAGLKGAKFSKQVNGKRDGNSGVADYFTPSKK